MTLSPEFVGHLMGTLLTLAILALKKRCTCQGSQASAPIAPSPCGGGAFPHLRGHEAST